MGHVNLIDQTETGSNELLYSLFHKSTDYDKNKAINQSIQYQNETTRHLQIKSVNSPWARSLFESPKSKLKRYNKLIIKRNRSVLCEYEFRSTLSETLIGSHQSANIQLKGAHIEKTHAKIYFQKGRYQIEDLDSVYGCFLNGKKLLPYTPFVFENGDRLRIMGYEVRLQCQPITESKLIEDKYNGGLVNFTFPKKIIAKESHSTEISSNIFVGENKIKPWKKGASELIVTHIINETDDVKTFRLLGLNPLSFSYLPGQFVTLYLNINNQQIQRSYSISSSSSRPYSLDLTVKRIPGGLVSNWLFDHVKQGDTLKVKGPFGSFSFLKQPGKKLLFIGAGSGVTPLMSMIRWLYDTAATKNTKVLFAFKHYKEVIFRRELEWINDSSECIDVSFALSRQKKRSTCPSDFSERIDSRILKTFSTDLLEREIYLCGPDSFIENVKNILHSLNFPMQHLHYESFTLSPAITPKTTSIGKPTNKHIIEKKQAQITHSVHFIKSKKTCFADKNTSLLDLAEAENIEIDYSCKSGACGECMVKCLSGQALMKEDCEIDAHERKQGWVFSCCTFANSDLVIDI